MWENGLTFNLYFWLDFSFLWFSFFFLLSYLPLSQLIKEATGFLLSNCFGFFFSAYYYF